MIFQCKALMITRIWIHSSSSFDSEFHLLSFATTCNRLEAIICKVIFNEFEVTPIFRPNLIRPHLHQRAIQFLSISSDESSF